MCGLAHTCVFAKQSLGPIHCGSTERRARGTVPCEPSLLPKLRDHYAEFLDHVSLVHLRLLASPTCVGFRYGHLGHSPRGFSRLSTPEDSGLGCPAPSHSRLGRVTPPYAVGRPCHQAALPSFQGHFVVHRHRVGAGILTGFPSSTPLGPRLRTRLTLR